ncbi:MAG: T9SS type A sorting domain-containing protein [Bacteroidota bacterium]
MRVNLLTLLFFFTAVSLFAQDFVQVSVGPTYSNQTYYTFDGDEVVSVPNTSWDLAFTATGFQDAGVFYNEATALGGSTLELYVSPTTSFDEVVDPNTITTPILFNDEQSWDRGAFNSIATPGSFFDYGWGQYDQMSNSVIGSTIYVLKLRDGSYKKIMVESLIITTYNVKIADLDGANEVTLTIDKADHAGADLVYYSIETNSIVTTVPNQWDLLFTRYWTRLEDDIDYSLTGVFSGFGVEVAEARGVTPTDADLDDFVGSFTPVLDEIGWDWKMFSFMSGWSLEGDLSYFVKLADNTVWHILFVDFEGSSTGTSVFQKFNLGMLTSVSDSDFVEEFSVFPNPVINEATVAVTLKEGGPIHLQLTNMLGQQVWTSGKIDTNGGFQVFTLPELNLAAGQYVLSLVKDGEVVSRKITQK